ncbi:MAG: hypothetical protein IJX81_07030 [Clostridia bacterium]|nr:hypothetical protein [Clostridia bacterium]
MRFRNAVLVLLENFKNTYKILLYKLVVSVVCTALYFALILPELHAIFSSAEWLTLKTDFWEFLAAFLPTGSAENFEAIQNKIMQESAPAFFQMLVGQAGGIALRLTACAAVYLVQRFVDTMCYFAVGSIINDRMSAYSDTPFPRAYLSNLSKSAKYSLVYVPIGFLFDLLSIVVCVLALEFVPFLYSLFACVATITLCQTVKLSCTYCWMPSIVADGKNLRGAMSALKTMDKKQHSKVFATNFAAVLGIIAVNVLGGLCTAGVALLLTVPASYLFLLCLQFVNYYTVTGKKYFITYDTIVKNSSFGDAEEFFKVIEREENNEE